MFKKSRRKIVVSIMAVLVLLFMGMLGVIYGSSYYEVSRTNHEMLERYAELYSLDKQPGEDSAHKPNPHSAPNDPPEDKPRLDDTPAFRLSTFYSVAVSAQGDVLAEDNNAAVYENEELARLSKKIIDSGRAYGTSGSLIYLVKDKGDYTLVAFKDNTVIGSGMTTLFQYTLIFGCTAIVFLFAIAVHLARQIVRPLEEVYGKQKQFISDAGHELKTPVSIVSANAEILLREIGENQWLSNIQYENERMGILVAQLLELARTENVSIQAERVDLSHLVYGEALPFESIAFEKNLTMQCDISEGLYISGSSAQMKQLVSILLDNAIRYCRAEKEITLALRSERNCAVLSVINDGDEIPTEIRSQIFERFYRADTVRNGDDKHYGLGLAIAKAIVNAHSGKIEVQCRGGKVEFVARIPPQK